MSITLVTGLHSCLVTGRHSWVTVSTYWVSHTMLCSVQQLGVDTGAGADTNKYNMMESMAMSIR